MSIIRVEKNTNYSVISNVHLQDKNLSWKAKGLLSYLLSKPNDWTILLKHLAKQSKDGLDATRTALKELIEAGYIIKEYSRNDKGQIVGRDYTVRENPIRPHCKTIEKSVNHQDVKVDYPKLDNPMLDNPMLDYPTLLNTDRIPLPNTDINERLTPAPRPLSPSFSKNSNPHQEPHHLKELIELLPVKYQSSHIINLFIERTLQTHSFDDLKGCILYTRDKSTGNPTQFKSYLGKCLDNGWYSGYLESIESERIESERVEAERALKAVSERQKIKAELEEQARVKAEAELVNEILKTIDIADLDSFIESPAIWKTINPYERRQWKADNRYITRRLKVKNYLQQKLLIGE